MNFTAKERDQFLIAEARVRGLWRLLCEFDGIDPTSKFVVFSPDNLHRVAHNAAMKELFALRKRIEKNARRRERHQILTDTGLKRVRGALGGVYYE